MINKFVNCIDPEDLSPFSPEPTAGFGGGHTRVPVYMQSNKIHKVF